MKNLSTKIAILGLSTGIILSGYGAYKTIENDIKGKINTKPALYIAGGMLSGITGLAIGRKIYNKEINYRGLKK